jgi:protein-tyrosine phosphatase
MNRESLRAAILVTALLIPAGVSARNLHKVDESPSGFALYRTGKPSEEDMKYFCEDLGLQQILVLSGDKDQYEDKYRANCPSNLKVVYDYEQDTTTPLTTGFLEQFDAWIKAAKDAGWKVAFRCDCGCHRTGRLAAYYQMKYMDYSTEEALADMRAKGEFMWWYMPRLRPQVLALKDYIDGKECRLQGQERKYCVADDRISFPDSTNPSGIGGTSGENSTSHGVPASGGAG